MEGIQEIDGLAGNCQAWKENENHKMEIQIKINPEKKIYFRH